MNVKVIFQAGNLLYYKCPCGHEGLGFIKRDDATKDWQSHVKQCAQAKEADDLNYSARAWASPYEGWADIPEPPVHTLVDREVMREQGRSYRGQKH